MNRVDLNHLSLEKKTMKNYCVQDIVILKIGLYPRNLN